MSGALDIRHLSVEIAGSPVLTDVILSIAPGAFVGLVGRNGAGKTTLMRAIMGLLPVRSGEMKFLDTDLRATQHLALLGVQRPSTSATCLRIAGWYRSLLSRRTCSCRLGQTAIQP